MLLKILVHLLLQTLPGKFSWLKTSKLLFRYFNTVVGYGACKSSVGNSHSNNTAIGYTALRDITTGSNNVALGFEAMKSVSTGTENVAIGFRSGSQINTGDSHVLVGNASGITLTNDEYKRMREYVRFILPEGRLTELYITMYLDDLDNFLIILYKIDLPYHQFLLNCFLFFS